MKSRALGAATADLFVPPAAATASVRAAEPMPASAPAVVAPAGPTPPTSAQTARRRAPPLWYAVVFTGSGVAPPVESERAAAWLRRLCLHAQRFTPLVSIEMPNALLLEIRGSIRLFGSLETLYQLIDATWRQLGIEARSAIAPATLAALWLARAGKREIVEDPGSLAGRLAQLPLACTAWDAERLGGLRALGVMRIGEIMRLPRAGVVRRFGVAPLLDLDIALARETSPRRIFVPRERFRERCDFEEEAQTVVYVEKALEPLVARCARFLRERQSGVQALELRLVHRMRRITRVRLGLASVTGEKRRLMDVVSHRLSGFAFTAPVLGLTLVSGPLQPLTAASLDVFAHPGRGAGGRDTAPRLVERLRARLGEAAVYGISPVEEHRPEAAWQRVQTLRLESVLPTQRKLPRVPMPHPLPPQADCGMPRPVWLLDEPAQLQSSEVRQLHCGEMVLEEGPERIESGWWDGKGVARDYYIARQSGGVRFWVFQERRSKHWYLHGVFA